MKQKIKEALQQGFKDLGLRDEALERVAASVETFISDESDIQRYVESDLVKSLMKFEQADADRKRTKQFKQTKLAEGEGEKATEESNLTPNAKQQPEVEANTPDIADIVAQAVAAAITPLQEELTAFKTAQAQKSAVVALDELKNSWDYANGYPDERDDAYERVMELYEVSGKKWNAEELTAKFKEKFNKAVSKKGVDTTQPFKSDGDAKPTIDFSKEIELLRSEGVEL